MLLVSLLISQVLWLGYQKQLLQNAAVEAAGFGALADQTVEAAEAKALQLFAQASAEAELTGSQPEIVKVTLKSNQLVPIEAVGYAVLEIGVAG